MDPVPYHCYAENLVAPGIEPGTSWLAARKSVNKKIENVFYVAMQVVTLLKGFKFLPVCDNF
jgi:hypothetical protein